MNRERLFVMSLAGQNLEFFALDAEDDSVGLVDSDTPPSTQVVAKRFRIADAGNAVAVDALQKQVDTLERLGVLSLPSETFAKTDDAKTGIDVKARLDFFGSPCLTFDCRRSSTEMLHSLFRDGLKAGAQKQENGFRHGYALAKKLLAQLVKGRVDDFADYLLGRVRIVRVVVPEDTDLNHYFEIMNSRGEQLEKHEILKAKLMESIPDESHRKCFGRIWDACSDMDCFVWDAGAIRRHRKAMVELLLPGTQLEV